MKTATLSMTPFVGIFNNRRVPFGAIIGDTYEAKSEDGLKK